MMSEFSTFFFVIPNGTTTDNPSLLNKPSGLFESAPHAACSIDIRGPVRDEQSQLYGQPDEAVLNHMDHVCGALRCRCEGLI